MTTMDFQDNILTGSKAYPKPQDRHYTYGTAGFRMNAQLLDCVVFRVAILASIRSRKLNGRAVGIMLTASHNPPEDNGVKLIDPMGEMLETTWETYATLLANAESHQALAHAYESLTTDLGIDPKIPANVIFARDTRESGPHLVKALIEGLNATAVKSQDCGLLTTPQLHYITRCLNTQNTPFSYGFPSEEGYYMKLAKAFKSALCGRRISGSLTVDSANGVGGPKLKELVKYLVPAADGGINLKLVNDDVANPANLNSHCGADFVKTSQRAPPGSQMRPLARWCSLDGDADRLIYYFVDEEDSRFHLLDGDRIATLAASFIGELAKNAGLSEKLRIGVVQTAYANGASTAYMTNDLKLPVVCTSTGVKHLHHAATKFDVGVYFEANGHGTVVFSELALKRINKYDPQSPAQAAALETLKSLTELINQTVGDAISDLLLVETILAHKSWGLKDWLLTYTDLPNRLVRIEVPDRSIFKTVDAERKLSEPRDVQGKIDAVVRKYKMGRSFARASGTEDAVRVYAEAATKAEAEELATAVARIILTAANQHGLPT